jgi:hypothetical protein
MTRRGIKNALTAERALSPTGNALGLPERYCVPAAALEVDMAKEKKPEEMTEEEIAEANGEPLPGREAMSVINLGEPAGGFTVDPPPTDVE